MKHTAINCSKNILTEVTSRLCKRMLLSLLAFSCFMGTGYAADMGDKVIELTCPPELFPYLKEVRIGSDDSGDYVKCYIQTGVDQSSLLFPLKYVPANPEDTLQKIGENDWSESGETWLCKGTEKCKFSTSSNAIILSKPEPNRLIQELIERLRKKFEEQEQHCTLAGCFFR